MKKIFTIAAIIAASVMQSQAQNQFQNRNNNFQQGQQQGFFQGITSMFKFRHINGSIIGVIVDGRDYGRMGHVVTVNNLTPGMHRVKLYTLRNNQRVFIYSGRLRAMPNNIYRCTFAPMQGLDVREYCCINNGNFNYAGTDFDYFDMDWDDNTWDGTIHQGGNGWNGNGNNGWNGNNGNGWNGNNGNGNNGWNGNNGNNGNNGWNGNNGNNGNSGWINDNNGNNGYWGTQNQCMNGTNFQAFKQTVSRASFDSGKMDLIKAQMQNAWISAAQLRELVELFSFESGKLDMAKFGAPHVVDRQNLFSIYDVFSFESSKSEFANFITTLQR